MKLRRLTALASLATAVAVLTGCHATVNAQWATADDTVDRWEKATPNLPVELRGQLPGSSTQQLAQAVPASQISTAGGEHWVIELGDIAPPSSDAYCAATHGADQQAGKGLAVTVTLCDGARLVASSRQPIDPANTQLDKLPRRIAYLKKLTLLGISRSPAQYIEVQS